MSVIVGPEPGFRASAGGGVGAVPDAANASGESGSAPGAGGAAIGPCGGPQPGVVALGERGGKADLRPGFSYLLQREIV